MLSVSLGHGFPWGDTPEVGTRVLVVTDGDLVAAEAARDRILAAAWAERDDFVRIEIAVWFFPEQGLHPLPDQGHAR